MTDFEDILRQLNTWAEEHNLIRRSMATFPLHFESEDGYSDGSQVSELEGWRVGDLTPTFHSHDLRFQDGTGYYNHITTVIGLYGADGRQVGTYYSLFHLDGEDLDDYFLWEMSKDTYVKTVRGSKSIQV